MRKSPQHVRGWSLPEARLVGQGDKRTPISSSAIQRIDRGVNPFFGFVARQAGGDLIAEAQGRSEEHTSELQSLMRISYAVFCLKKKKNTTQTTTHTLQYESDNNRKETHICRL